MLRLLDYTLIRVSNKKVILTGKKTGLIILLISALAAFILNIATGSVRIPLKEIASSLITAGNTSGSGSSLMWKTIIFELRLPRALAAAAGGGALALSGLLLQTFFRNPLAGPDVLGIASGAGLGSALVILALPFLQTGGISSVTASASGAFAVTMFLVFLVKKHESMTLTLIAGLLAGYFLHSITGIMIRFSTNQALRSYVNWSAGSFRNTSPGDLGIFLPVLAVSFIAAFVISKQSDLYLLGEEYALSMGLNIRRYRYAVIILASVMTGAVTSLCGPVSFIGIAAPHFCRMVLKTDRHSLLVPGVILSGAVLALAADMLTALPGGGTVLPLNSVTAIIGAPIVINVLLKRHYD